MKSRILIPSSGCDFDSLYLFKVIEVAIELLRIHGLCLSARCIVSRINPNSNSSVFASIRNHYLDRI